VPYVSFSVRLVSLFFKRSQQATQYDYCARLGNIIAYGYKCAALFATNDLNFFLCGNTIIQYFPQKRMNECHTLHAPIFGLYYLLLDRAPGALM
jgi:hypothetical protein